MNSESRSASIRRDLAEPISLKISIFTYPSIWSYLKFHIAFRFRIYQMLTTSNTSIVLEPLSFVPAYLVFKQVSHHIQRKHSCFVLIYSSSPASLTQSSIYINFSIQALKRGQIWKRLTFCVQMLYACGADVALHISSHFHLMALSNMLMKNLFNLLLKH